MGEHLSICSPPRDLPTDHVLDGESPPAELAESGTASHPTPPEVSKEAAEVLSRRAPSEPNTGGGGDDVMAEVNTSAAKDQAKETPLATEEGERCLAQPPPRTSPERSMPPEVPAQSPTGGRVGGSTPVPPMTGWLAMMEEALAGSSIAEDHCALVGAVLQGIQSVDSRLKQAFNGLLTGFKVSHIMLFFQQKLLYQVYAILISVVAPEPWVSLKNPPGGQMFENY